MPQIHLSRNLLLNRLMVMSIPIRKRVAVHVIFKALGAVVVHLLLLRNSLLGYDFCEALEAGSL
jgi:hypothetical protein